MQKYIFLTSASFSGSTLLSFMIGAHPRIATIGEIFNSVDLGDPDKYRCSCGQPFKECEFWQKVFILMMKSHHNFSYKNFQSKFSHKHDSFLERLQFLNLRNNMISEVRDYIYEKIPKYRDNLHSILERNIDIAKAVLCITGKEIFFDTTKNAIRIKILRKHLNCEFKVIHLVKDGRGVFDSCKRYRPEWSDRSAILMWKKANKYAERALEYVEKSNKYRLLYKNLVNNPEHELAKLSDFIGVEYTPDYLNFKNWEHHIIGNERMRMGKNTKIYYDEKWRENLSVKQIKYFDRLAGNMNRKYGYFD